MTPQKERMTTDKKLIMLTKPRCHVVGMRQREASCSIKVCILDCIRKGEPSSDQPSLFDLFSGAKELQKTRHRRILLHTVSRFKINVNSSYKPIKNDQDIRLLTAAPTPSVSHKAPSSF